MKIIKIDLSNFKLFKTLTFAPQRTNLFRGINADNGSSNASGKTTAALDAIIFALYGKSSVNLKDVVTQGESSCTVSLHILKGEKEIEIIRSYPTKLSIKIDGVEQEFVSSSKAQKLVDDLFGSYEDFRMYRTLDVNKGLNILDLGSTSLKTTLMSFIERDLTFIREGLKSKKLERETYNVDKKIYPHYYSTRRLATLQAGIDLLQKDIEECRGKAKEEQIILSSNQGRLSFIKAEIKRLTSQNTILGEEIKLCPTCKQPIIVNKANEIIKENNKGMEGLKEEVTLLSEGIIESESFIRFHLSLEEDFRKTLTRLQGRKELLQRLEKTTQYKYTKRDVLLYTEAIKKLDIFYLEYINTWLKGLECIINDSLKVLNMSVTFINDKRFLILKDGEQELTYEQLSSGQKTFLNIIFKLAILLYKGLDGIVIIDEGVDSLDTTNIGRLINVFNSLPFQIFLISQHDGIEHGVQVFTFKRSRNLSTLEVL